MARKRKSTECTAAIGSAKKAKPPKEEFTGTSFKTQLKNTQEAMKGLETFISVARKLPCEGLYDVVEGYIKISMDCAEIFKLLDGEKRPESEMLLIFQALEVILLRTASDLSHFSVVGMNIVKKIINAYMKLLYSSLYSESHRMARICLNLMSAMVTQGPDSARDFFSQFDFHNKFLSGLLKKRDKQGRPDVRMAYIQFAVSFLIAGDRTTIVQLLELKDFIPAIFSTGIKEDRISTINLLLSSLQTKVVRNQNINKTQKVHFFSANVLSQIASLYRWDGIVDVSTDDVKVVLQPGEAGKHIIRELVHNFLMELCCSLKHGINFYDPSIGTAVRAGNLVLLRFVVGLKAATEDNLVADLVVNILKVCPDLLSRYFKETQYSFVPRLKSAWLDNVKLLKKIYEAQPEVSNAFRTSEFIPLSRLLSMVMITTVPPICNKTMFTQGLNLPNQIVKHTTLTLLSSVLKRALSTIDHCLNEELWQESEIYSSAVMEEFAQRFREAVSKPMEKQSSKGVDAHAQYHCEEESLDLMTRNTSSKKNNLHLSGPTTRKQEFTEHVNLRHYMPRIDAYRLLPDLNSIVSTWNSLLKESKLDQGDERKDKKAAAPVEEPGFSSGDAETVLLKASILHTICLYQKVVPHLVAQSTFDFSKLLKGVVNEKGMEQKMPPVLQYNILQVALELPANKFSWFSAQDAKKVCGEKSVFSLLLKMFVTSNHPQLKTSTKLLIVKILRDSGVFDYTWKELNLWLEHLDKIEDTHKEPVINFLEKILIKLMSNPHPYTDKAADAVQEASVLQVNVNQRDSDSVSVPISHIDDVLDMVDVIVEGSEGLDEEIGFTMNEDLILNTFPFSAVVPASLEARNTLLLRDDQSAECMLSYLQAVLTDILHCQRDPLAFCLLLQSYDKEVSSLNMKPPLHSQIYQLNTYYSRWIPKQVNETLFEQAKDPLIVINLKDQCSFSTVLKNAYSSHDVLLLAETTKDQLKEAISKLKLSELLLAVKQVMLYLKTTVDDFSKLSRGPGSALVTLFMDLLYSLICRLDQENISNQRMPVESLTATDLFLDTESFTTEEPTKDEVLQDILTAILKHPVLDNWFLALEHQTLPQHNLNPVTVKLLSGHINSGIINLLKLSAPMLENINCLDILSKYFHVVTQCILKELKSRLTDCSKMPDKMSQPLMCLQDVYQYLDTPMLKDVTLAMLQLPEDCLTIERSKNETTKEKRLSFYGEALVQLLTESNRRQPTKREMVISTEHIKGLGILLSTSSSEELAKVLLYALQTEPVFTHAVSVDVLVYCLGQMTETCVSIGALLVHHSRTHLFQFELWCLKTGQVKHLRKYMDAYIPLIDVYLLCKDQYNFSRPLQVSSAVLEVLRDAFWNKLMTVALTNPHSETLSQQLAVFSNLVPSAEEQQLLNLIEQLPGILALPENHQSWIVADAISSVLKNSVEQSRVWKQSLLSACTKYLTASYTSNKEHENLHDTEASILTRLDELLLFLKEMVVTEWNNFVKKGLKCRYKDNTFLRTLKTAIDILYETESPENKEIIQLPMLHMMVTQHSLFLQSFLLSRDEESLDSNRTREALVDVLSSIVQKCPSVCDINHLAVLLGAYGATMSITDQKILLLLRMYENNKISLTDFRLLLWGPAAVEHHKTRKSLGKSLWQQPSTDEVLSLLDRERMSKTIAHFPRHRHLHPKEGARMLFTDENVKDFQDLYDPCFLLPLFSELVRPEYLMDCRKFVEVNALGLTVAALSSYDSKIRAAAYYVLGSFHSHLDGPRFRDRRQLLYLMDVLKNGIRRQNLRLAFPLTLYVAKVAQQCLNPEDHMYIKINKFLLMHQYLDLQKVPDFHKLFFSFDIEHKVEQKWTLRLLADGLQDRCCYELYNNQRIFQIIMSYYNSPLSSGSTQDLIFEILQNAAMITKAAYELIRDHSILTWILHLLNKKFHDNRMLASVITLLSNLWKTILGDRVSEKEAAEKQPKLLPLQIINEFLHVFIKLIECIRTNLELVHLTQFFSSLSSILRYRATVMTAFKQMDRFTLNESVFSTNAILMLLHKWSVIEKDKELQGDLQTLAQKYKVKELLKTIKEKNKPHVLGWSLTRQSRKKVNVDLEDKVDEQKNDTLLETCQEHLEIIFLYWEPTFPSLSTNLPAKQDGIEELQEETVGLVCTTAYVVVKWVLKCMATHTINWQNVFEILQWLKTKILPHGAVTDEILRDCGLKSVLFKIYNQVNNASCMKTLNFGALHLFNTVMIQLLEAQGIQHHRFHEALKELCQRAGNEEDDKKKAALVFLVSVYIGDMWLLAQDTEKFMIHVRAVCEATHEKSAGRKEKSPKGKGQKQSEEAIVIICKEISAVTLLQ